MFADVAQFTPLCKELPPATVMAFLNDLFGRFDQLLDIYGVYKVRKSGSSRAMCGMGCPALVAVPCHAHV